MFEIVKKDLESVLNVFKNNGSVGFKVPDLHEQYKSLVTDPDMQVTREYLNAVVTFGIDNKVLAITGYGKSNRGAGPKLVALSSDMNEDDWSTFLELYRADSADKNKARKKVAAENKKLLDGNDVRVSKTPMRKKARAKNRLKVDPTLKSWLEKNIVDKYLDNRLPKGTIDQLASKHNVSKGQIKYLLKKIKVERGIFCKTPKGKIEGDFGFFYDALMNHNITRKLANHNRVSSTKMRNALQFKIPHGGSGLIAGTQTPFAASDNRRNNMILTDELEVAIAMDMFTDETPKIIQGNSVSPVKAHKKALMWERNNSTSHFNIEVGPVDSVGLTQHIVTMVEKHPLTKVALITGGQYQCCESTWKKYKQNFDFKTPCERLTAYYPMLHIMVMVFTGRNFKVLYLHNGKQEWL